MAEPFDPNLSGFRTTPVGADMLYALLDDRKLTAVWGGVGSGKSWAIAQLCAWVAMTRQTWDPVDERPDGPVDILITGAIRSELLQNLQRAFESVFEPLGAVWISDPKWMRWEFPNGARVTCQHYQCHGEQKSTIEGRTCSFLVSDESGQLKSTFFMHSFERCRKPSIDIWGRIYKPQLCWVGRPSSGDAYLREAKMRLKNGKDVAIIYARTRDNPWNDEGYLEDIRDGRSQAEFEAITQEVPGATFPSKGAIYSDFEPATWPDGNLVDLAPDDIEGQPTWIAIDTSVMFTSVLWLQVHVVDGEPLLVVVDEWHPHGVPTAIQDIIREAEDRPWAICGVIIDPAARSRQKAAGLASEVDVISREPGEDPDGLGGGLGVPVRSTLPVNRRSVRDGIMRVMARIRTASGRRCLAVLRHLWDEPEHEAGIRHMVQMYAWDPVTGKPRKGDDCHQADHCADVLRYAVCHLAWYGPPEPIVEEYIASTERIRQPRRHGGRRNRRR